MKIKELLMKESEIAFSELMVKYSLKLVELKSDERSVFLLGKSYVIGIYFDPYGMSYTYNDLEGDFRKVINLINFFAIHRIDKFETNKGKKWSDMPLIEYLPLDLSNFSYNMLRVGKDILEGDKAWLKQYKWSGGTMPEDVYSELMEIIKVSQND